MSSTGDFATTQAAPASSADHQTVAASRRGFLGAALMLVSVAPHAAPDAPASSPDSELIALCDRLRGNRVGRNALCDADPWAPDFGSNHQAFLAFCEERDALEERMFELPPPATHEGLRALARAALSEVADQTLGGEHVCRDFAEWLALGVAEAVAAGVA